MSAINFLLLSGAIVTIVVLVFTVVFYALRAAAETGENSDGNQRWQSGQLQRSPDQQIRSSP